MTNTGVLAASRFRDVQESFWGYDALLSVTEQGFMSADSWGNFNPNDFLSLFDAARILARAAGYKPTGASLAERNEYDRAYADHIGTINQFAAVHERWDQTASMEIAYLLHKGIFVRDDLMLFFRFTNNQDRLAVLTKERASVFLVRLIGRNDDAMRLNVTIPMLFADDLNISASCRQHVYYLRSIGVVGGDTAGFFSPGSGATRAIFAVMLDNTLKAAEKLNTNDTQQNSNTFNGSIINVYTSFRAVYVMSPDPSHNNRIYSIAPDAVIRINGQNRTFADLSAGMEIIANVQNGEIRSITASSLSTPQNNSPGTNNNQISVSNEIPLELNTLEGTVASSRSDLTGNFVEIELKLINPRGIIYTEKRTYRLHDNCPIYRGDTRTIFTNIAAGDIITVSVHGTVAYNIRLEEKNRRINGGTIIEKKVSQFTNAPIIVVRDENNKIFELTVRPSSSMRRNSAIITNHNDLRVGDTVNANLEYDVIIDIQAFGIRTTIEGWVREINISLRGSSVTVADSDGTEATYQIIGTLVNVYSLRIGSRVRVRLDSLEVEAVTVLQEQTLGHIVGFVHSFNSWSITISETAGSSFNTSTYFYDSSTIMTDATTGNRVNQNALRNGMRVNINFEQSGTLQANTITILNH
jgi:hypothetical protein